MNDMIHAVSVTVSTPSDTCEVPGAMVISMERGGGDLYPVIRQAEEGEHDAMLALDNPGQLVAICAELERTAKAIEKILAKESRP
jgi:hypothetical protein